MYGATASPIASSSSAAGIADAKLDPIDRATALKYLVHFVGDIHQPLHATGVEIGGNGIPVTAFGGTSCSTSGKCNLHNIWDGYLIDHRNLTDAISTSLAWKPKFARRRSSPAT